MEEKINIPLETKAETTEQNTAKDSNSLPEAENRETVIETAVQIEHELTETAENADGMTAPAARANLLGELRSLTELIPDADIRSLDDIAWESVLSGEQLLVAYLASERRKREAEAKNAENEKSSVGEIKGSGGELFSIDEIKQMPRSYVRKNLDKILKSLEKK